MLRFTELNEDGTAGESFDYPGNSIEDCYWIAKSDPSAQAQLICSLHERTSARRFKTDLVDEVGES